MLQQNPARRRSTSTTCSRSAWHHNISSPLSFVIGCLLLTGAFHELQSTPLHKSIAVDSIARLREASKVRALRCVPFDPLQESSDRIGSDRGSDPVGTEGFFDMQNGSEVVACVVNLLSASWMCGAGPKLERCTSRVDFSDRSESIES